VATPPAVTPQQRALVEKLEHALLAPCCYQEVVATHNSEQAKAMRAEIAAMVAAGKTEREILDYYKQRYGARILAEPEGAQWWVMNVVPIIMLAGGAIIVVRLLRKWRRGAATAGA
jgi:cytochrome c-type biogenesis protein CcmH